MAMQPDATVRHRIVDRDNRTERVASVIAARTERGADVLGAIVNRVAIKRMRYRPSEFLRIWTNPHAFVIDAGGESSAHPGCPILSAVVANISEALAAGELHCPHPTGVGIGKQNRVGRSFVAYASRRVFEFPFGPCRRSGIVESDAQNLVKPLIKHVPAFRSIHFCIYTQSRFT